MMMIAPVLDPPVDAALEAHAVGAEEQVAL